MCNVSNISELNLRDSIPLITSDDIESCDWKTFTINLKKETWNQIFNRNPRIDAYLPELFVIVIDGEAIIEGLLWNDHSVLGLSSYFCPIISFSDIYEKKYIRINYFPKEKKVGYIIYSCLKRAGKIKE